MTTEAFGRVRVSRRASARVALGILVAAASFAGCAGPMGEPGETESLGDGRGSPVDFGMTPGSASATETIRVSPVDAWGDMLAAGLAEIDRDGGFSRLVLASLRESGADVVGLRELLAVAPEGSDATYGEMLGAVLEKRYPAPLRRLGALGSGRVVDSIIDDMVYEGELYSMNLHVPAIDETDLSRRPYFSPAVEVGDDLIHGYRLADDDTLEAQEISEGFARRAPVIVLDPGAVVERRAPRLSTYSLGVFEALRARDLVLRDDTPRVQGKQATSPAETALKAPPPASFAPCSWPAINPTMDWFVIYQKWENRTDGKPEVYYSYSTYSLPYGLGWGAQEDYIQDSVDVGSTQWPYEYTDTIGTFCDGNDYLWLTIYEYDWYAGLKYSGNTINGDTWAHHYRAKYSSEVYYDNPLHTDPVSYWTLYPSGNYTLYGGAGTFHLVH